MGAEWRVLSYLVTFILVLISAVFSSLKGARWEERNPGKLGFKWGYFFVANTVLNSVIGFAVLAVVLVPENEVTAVALIFPLVLLQVGAAYFALRRSRVALIAMTVFSFNPLWMIINIFYFRNRWSEFREEGSKANGFGSTASSTRRINKPWRIAGFLSFGWAVSVPAFVFLAKPYGRMYDDDFAHMFAVILLPPLIGATLLWVYRRFVQ